MIFSLSMVLSNVTFVCIHVVFFMFLILGVHWTSWICEFISFHQIWKKIGHCFSNIFSDLFLLFPSGIPIPCLVNYGSSPRACWCSVSFFKLFFLSVSFWIVSIVLDITAFISRNSIEISYIFHISIGHFEYIEHSYKNYVNVFVNSDIGVYSGLFLLIDYSAPVGCVFLLLCMPVQNRCCSQACVDVTYCSL